MNEFATLLLKASDQETFDQRNKFCSTQDYNKLTNYFKENTVLAGYTQRIFAIRNKINNIFMNKILDDSYFDSFIEKIVKENQIGKKYSIIPPYNFLPENILKPLKNYILDLKEKYKTGQFSETKNSVIDYYIEKMPFFSDKLNSFRSIMSSTDFKKQIDKLIKFKYSSSSTFSSIFFGSPDIKKYIDLIDTLKVPLEYDYFKENLNKSSSGRVHMSICLIYKHKQIVCINGGGEIEYNCASERLYTFNVNLDLFSCKNKRFKFFMLLLSGFDGATGHMNILLFDSHLKTLERFEPHGKKSPNNCDSVDNAIKNTWPSITYIPPSDICPYTHGPQRIVEDRYCTIWSYFYLDLRLEFPDISQQKILEIMIKDCHPETMRKFSYLMYNQFKIWNASKNFKKLHYMFDPPTRFSSELLKNTTKKAFGKSRRRRRRRRSKQKKLSSY